MNKNVFAYTGNTPPDGYAAYVSINIRDGKLRVTACAGGCSPAEVEVPDQWVPELIKSLLRYAAERGLTHE